MSNDDFLRVMRVKRVRGTGEGGAETFAGGHRREPDERGCDEHADRGADGRGGRDALGCCGGHRLSRWPAWVGSGTGHILTCPPLQLSTQTQLRKTLKH